MSDTAQCGQGQAPTGQSKDILNNLKNFNIKASGVVPKWFQFCPCQGCAGMLQMSGTRANFALQCSRF